MVKVIGPSVDTLERHAGWNADIEETQGQRVNFPMIADPDHKVSSLCGMIHPDADAAPTVRIVFVINPQKPCLSYVDPAKGNARESSWVFYTFRDSETPHHGIDERG